VSELLAKLRTRKLVQWTVGYLAGAWVAAEVLAYLSDLWNWPQIVGRVGFVLLAVGLGVAVVLAWYHGERGRQRPSALETTLLGALALTGILATVVLVRADGADSRPDGYGTTTTPTSLVVLPFADLSPGGGREYLGDGIAETLINGLARLEGLRVVARTSSFQFKGMGMDVRQIAARLGVGAVVEGSVVQSGDRVRVSAMLVDARSGLDLWSDRFDREVPAADLFTLQDDVAQAIVEGLRVELGAKDRIVGRGTRDPGAQRAYFLGVHHWTRRTTEDVAQATTYFHEAIGADSLYAEAWAGLALAYVLHIPSEYNVPGLSEEEALARAEAAARKAIALDSTLAQPHTALADIREARGDWDGAYREFQVAIRKNPGYATAHHWLADLLMAGLRGEEALAEIDLAVSLDPVAPAILAERAQALMILGRTDEATAQMDRAIELLADNPLVHQFAFVFAAVLDEWDRAGARLATWLELGGVGTEAAAQVASQLSEAGSRERFLASLADGRLPDPVLDEASVAERLQSPNIRFLAVVKVRGEDAALDYLEEVISGPEASGLYAPLLPAILGPELVNEPRVRRLMASLYSPQDGG
jgi:TolB-like protein/tetratricopeptide (TPR) repeat protein